MSGFERYVDDPMAFRMEQLILDGKGTRLGDVIERWQLESIYEPLDEQGEDGRSRYRLAYLEMPRGHAKTTMVAGEGVTQLVYGGNEWQGHIVAGDKSQANELFNAAAGFIKRNPNLRTAFNIQRDRITAISTGATLRVHSSDAPTAHGLIVDWFAFDEFWNQPDRELWDAFYTAVVKRPDWRGLVITTAGFDKKTICWEVRELAQKRDDFYAFIAPGQLASWITEEETNRLRETLPAHVFQRFVENKWVEGSGSFITKDALLRCVDDRLRPMSHGYRGLQYVIGVDLGLTKDRTALAIMHEEDDLFVLDDLQVWEGRRGEPVAIREVEAAILAASQEFPTWKVVCDPWQMASTIQRFQGRIEEFRFTAQSVSHLSANLLRVITTRQLRIYQDDDLIRELVELQAEQTSYGWRIDHARGGHDDRAMAIGMCALVLAERERRAGPVRHPRQSPMRFGGGTSWRRTDAVARGRRAYVNGRGEISWRQVAEMDGRAQSHLPPPPNSPGWLGTPEFEESDDEEERG